MAIEGEVQAVLAALVSGRCYPASDIPDSPVRPYITFQVISNPSLNTLDGAANISNRRFQVNGWVDKSAGYGAAKVLAAGIVAAMAAAAFTNTKISDYDTSDAETKSIGIIQDFSVWGAA